MSIVNSAVLVSPTANSVVGSERSLALKRVCIFQISLFLSLCLAIFKN